MNDDNPAETPPEHPSEDYPAFVQSPNPEHVYATGATSTDLLGLRDAVVGLDKSIQDLITVQNEDRKASRNTRNAFIVATVIGLLVALAFGYIIKQNRDNAVAACESGNRRISANQAASKEDWRINEASAEAQGFEKDNPLRKFYRDRLKWQLEEQYPFRDCDNLGEPIPLPGDPPSFEEALKEALKYEKTH